MMTRESVLLKRELSRGERGRGKRYPAELRGRVAAWAQGRKQAGASWVDMAQELGVGLDTVRRWCVPKKAVVTSRSLLPVRVVETRAEPARLVVVSPNGFRVEGLTLTEAAALLKALG
jgi:predicted NBD/HSP70 family sugar kinase